MAERLESRLVLACCVLVLVLVGWAGLQVRDLAHEVATQSARRIQPMQKLISRDVVNQSGTKADIETTKGDTESLDQFVARHNACVAAWKASTTPQ